MMGESASVKAALRAVRMIEDGECGCLGSWPAIAVGEVEAVLAALEELVAAAGTCADLAAWRWPVGEVELGALLNGIRAIIGTDAD